MILLTKACIVIYTYTLFLCQHADTLGPVEVICLNVVLGNASEHERSLRESSCIDHMS